MANEDKRIIELPASESILNDDWIGKDSASQGTTRLQLSFLKQLCGGNNFAGEWHSGTVYNKEAYVTHEGKLYHNIKGGSVVAVDWSSSQWEQVSIGNELRKIVESLAPTFDTSTNYKVDDLVIYDNTLYRCIAAHTAGTWVGSHFGTVKVSSLLLYGIMDNFTEIYWENYSGSPVNYTKGTVIHKGLTLYRCKADTTNQSWDSSKWEQVDVTDLLATEHGYIQSLISSIAPTFSSSTQYSINDFVIYNNQLYICTKPHHGSWDSTDFSLAKIGDALEFIFNIIADVYSPSGSYVKGDVVNYLGMPLRCIVDIATSPMVVSEWEQVTVEQLIDEKVADVQIAGQTTVDENHISDLTSLAIEGTASGEIATFNDGSNLPMKSFICNITANQDLHGYDAPWVGGAGKNKLKTTFGTQSDHGVTFTKNNDGTVTVNGKAEGGTAVCVLVAASLLPQLLNTSIILNGNPYASIKLQWYNYDGKWHTAQDNGRGVTFTPTSSSGNVAIVVAEGITCNNVIVKPMIRFTTETDATYEPYENICPISGYTGVDAWVKGKNLFSSAFDTSTVNGVTCTKNSDTTFTLNGKATGGSATFVLAASSMYSFLWGNSVILEGNPGASGVRLQWWNYDANWHSAIDYGSGTGVFVPNGTGGNIAILVDEGIECNNLVIKPIIQLASVWDALYKPPITQTIQVSWQTEAGEVFGGYVDLVSGVLVVDRAMVDMGALNYSYYHNDTRNDFYTTISSAITPIVGGDVKAICSVYEREAFLSLTNGGFCISDSTLSSLQKLFLVRDFNYTDATAFKTAMNGAQLVYELATPITYQLTPTQIKSLLGKNNAWCSTGDVNAKYNKDATTVINSLIARIEALENA